MLKVVFDLTDFEEVELVPVSDVHIGNQLCDIQTLHDIISYINDEPDDPKCARICLLNGDLTESVTRQSVGNVFDMTMTPSVQVATMIQMLKPLAEPREHYPKGKILSYCGGNHDTERYKDTGISASESIAVGLEMEDRYSANGCYSFIKLKRTQCDNRTTVVTVYNQHLTGSASTVGGKANRIEKISNGVLADLYVGGHYHLPMTYKEDVIMPNYSQYSLTQKTMTYVIVNAFLRYGDYAQKMGLKPSSITIPKIFLRQKRTMRKTESDTDRRFINVEVLL